MLFLCIEFFLWHKSTYDSLISLYLHSNTRDNPSALIYFRPIHPSMRILARVEKVVLSLCPPTVKHVRIKNFNRWRSFRFLRSPTGQRYVLAWEYLQWVLKRIDGSVTRDFVGGGVVSSSHSIWTPWPYRHLSKLSCTGTSTSSKDRVSGEFSHNWDFNSVGKQLCGRSTSTRRGGRIRVDTV